MTLETDYRVRFEKALKELAKRVELQLQELCADEEHIDRITARAKSVDRFVQKALKNNSDGTAKYKEPFEEIQDQIGARIIVFYVEDVARVRAIILNYLRPIESKSQEPLTAQEFAYFGYHVIAFIPGELKVNLPPEYVPSVFELQIKTLFQHAWSECNHDLGYKPSKPLTQHQQRLLACAAAQAWAADEVFSRVLGDSRMATEQGAAE